VLGDVLGDHIPDADVEALGAEDLEDGKTGLHTRWLWRTRGHLVTYPEGAMGETFEGAKPP
jgi:hypothetical protein